MTWLRRTWMSTVLAILSLGLLGAQACAPAICSDLTQTTMFLSDDATDALYSVHFMLEPLDARLLFISDTPDGVTQGHIAATPDARRVYLIDATTHRFFYYDVLLLTWTDLGIISGLTGSTSIQQAVIGRDGTTLYVGQNGVGIYSIDLSAPSPTATFEASIPATNGGDLTFGINGELYQANRQPNDGTLHRVTLTGNPFSPIITPVGNGDLGLETSGLAAYPHLTTSEDFVQVLVSSIGIGAQTPVGGLAWINQNAGPNDPPVINFNHLSLNGSIFVHDAGDMALPTCF